jgi:transcriptional regulator with XRE-family HTH domain
MGKRMQDAYRIGLAATLRRLRRSRGLSQRALAGPLHLGAHSTIADYESGRRIPPADVLRLYERYFALRSDELSVLRDKALAERAESEPVRPGPLPVQHEPAEAVVIPRQLPRVPLPFTGRRAEVQHLDGLLGSDSGSTGAVISGMAGVGKTALAIWWAHRQTRRFPDGVLYVNLRGYDATTEPVNPSTVLDGFLRALGVSGSTCRSASMIRRPSSAA